ncbi:hypothetical protein F-LCD7_0004 [Faustovirus]|nr:hypothetical protein F-LCD7_0004 [Faustovirus]QJX72765.1 hypothetical protein F-VV57_0003 [Faustovirus]QJX73270.1 hypothetical protein F-VV63_0004 [Faustovirus]
MESMDVVPVMWYDMLPREIWAEIGMANWMAYKVAIRLNKALNAMLRDVDIKARYAAKVDCEMPKYGGWVMPDSNWLMKYKIIGNEVYIRKKDKLVKQYQWRYVSWSDNSEIIDDYFMELIDMKRYHYGRNKLTWRERVRMISGYLIVVRTGYRGQMKLERDTYNSHEATISHYSVLFGTTIGPSVIKSGYDWRVKCPGFFIWFN